MKRAGFPITIERAFTASSHGGWHGDGMYASIYKFSTNDVSALVDSLRRNFTNFVWTECQAHTASIGDLRKLVPPEMMPALGTRLLNGRLADGNPTREYLVDTSQGILYDITHTF